MITNAPTSTSSATAAETTAMDAHARRPLLFLIGSALVWLLLSGVFGLITSIQLHSPGFLANCEWFTHGRAQALRETAFIYGWAANAGLAIVLWVLGRLGGEPLRGLNWTVTGTVFWNLGLTLGLIGIAVGDMTSFSWFQLPRYVQPLMLFAYATVAMTGVLAWSGRRHDMTYAAQWYGVAALFLFPWAFSAAQIVLLWSPVRGTVQSVAAAWYAQSAMSLWLAPLAMTAAYYIVPKVAGKALPSYKTFALLGFWTLIFTGPWTAGRFLVGGPVPVWVPTMAVAAASMLLFHFVVVGLNLRIGFGPSGNAIKFIRFGLFAYVLTGLLEVLTSFAAIAETTQFTLLMNALEQLGLYGGISMIFFGAIYYMVPRLTGAAWASSALVAGHRVLVMAGVVALVVTLTVAGWTQSVDLLNPKTSLSAMLDHIGLPLLLAVGANIVLLAANALLLVNFCRTACAGRTETAPAETLFRRPVTLEAPVS